MREALFLFGQNKIQIPLPHVEGSGTGKIQTVMSIVFAMFGAIALIVLVIAGLRYVSSSGDPTTMSKAKNTIIYAAIGLIVSMSAFAIVGFVLGNV